MSKFPIPDEVLIHHIGILGKAGSGKTYAAKGVVERLLRRHERVCIVDPTGVWWGLRLDRDGKSAGLPVVIFGGRHADLPLKQEYGATIAETVGTTSTPVVIDTSLMTVGERTRFFTAFAETLLRKNKGPLHLILDEAHVFAPQGKVPDPDAGKMLHATNNLVGMGRARGLRITLISQRPAKLHKDSLTQVETLVAMRLIAPQDRKAVEEWVGEWADPKDAKELLTGLPSLKTGAGWVWAPEKNLLDQVAFPSIRTFDSSSAPTDDADELKLSEIDVERVKAMLGKVAEDAKANDPAALKREIARLQAEARKRPSVVKEPTQRREDAATIRALKGAVEIAMKLLTEISAEDFFKAGGEAVNKVEVEKAIASAMARVSTLVEASVKRREDEIVRLRREAGRIVTRLRAVLDEDMSVKVSVKHNEPYTVSTQTAAQASGPRRSQKYDGNGSLNVAQRAFLIALAQQARPLARNQVAIFSGYSAASRHVDNTLASLRSSGLISGGGDRIEITDEGISALGPYDPLPTGDALRNYWMQNLDKAASAFLRVVCDAYPSSITRDGLAERAGYSPLSRHVDNTLAQLRSRDLVNGGRGEIRANEALFG